MNPGSLLNVAAPSNVFHPTAFARKIKIATLKVVSDKLIATFEEDSNHVNDELTVPLIISPSDSGRQAYCCLIVFELMNYIWSKHMITHNAVALRVHTIRVMPITQNIFVQEAIANTSEFTDYPICNLSKSAGKFANFLSSAAGMYVAMFVLSIREQNETCYLIHKNGTLFLQYFEAILNPKPYARIFPVNRKIKSELGTGFSDFLELCSFAYQSLLSDRQHLIVAAATIMEGLSVESKSSTEQVLKDSLSLPLPEAEALGKFRQTVLGLSPIPPPKAPSLLYSSSSGHSLSSSNLSTASSTSSGQLHQPLLRPPPRNHQ